MADSCNIALIGAGSMGRRHIEAMASVKEAILVAIADPSSAADALGKAQGIPVFADAEQMLTEADIDAVIIATPTESHHADVMTVLRHKKTALVEKPITATIDEAREVTNFAATQGCNVLVGHQRRYYPCAERARDILQSGRIGKLIAVSGQWTTRKDDAYYEPDWRRDEAAGPILTNLIHEIDLLRFICGDIASVSAHVTHADQQFAKEDAVAISMGFANGAVGTFVLSDRTPSPWTWEMALGESVKFPRTGQNAIRFMSTKGALEFPNLVLWTHDESDGDWQKEIHQQGIETAFIDAYIVQCRHLCAVANGTETPRIDALEGSKSLEATLAAAVAASDGKQIKL